ncbi:hypothetical protein M0804_014237 [Polistes exclamans]|nr:hypothetical protein M0804_014237 [Polistes exclamans]
MYTLKISILNLIELTFVQRLAIINNNNQTKIVTKTGKFIRPLIRLSAKDCNFIDNGVYLCRQITTAETGIIHGSNETMIIRTNLIREGSLQTQGYESDEDLEEIEQVSLL